MIAVAPRGKLLALTLAALVDRHVTEAFPERAVNAPQFSTALPALHFRLVYIAICGSATSGGRMCRVHREGARAHRKGWDSLHHYYAGPYHRARRTAAQSEEYRCRDSAQYADGNHRPQRVGEVLAGIRHHLCRRAAPLRGDAFDLRAPISRSDGAARCRFDRRPEPGDLDRAEDYQPQPAVDRRHDHRDLRLPAS